VSQPVAERRVLIVDDDRQIRRVLSEFFEGAGFACMQAINGKEGLALFQAERPPLTVTDVQMPALSGVEFLKQARALDPHAAFLVLTGVGDIQTAVTCLLEGLALVGMPMSPHPTWEEVEAAMPAWEPPAWASKPVGVIANSS